MREKKQVDVSQENINTPPKLSNEGSGQPNTKDYSKKEPEK